MTSARLRHLRFGATIFSPAVLPGADELLKLGNGPGLFQVLNGGIKPAQEPPPVSYQQVRGCGHSAMRAMHHRLGLVNLPFDVGAVRLHQAKELRLGDKRGGSARQ
jgi:hypothetical protein